MSTWSTVVDFFQVICQTLKFEAPVQLAALSHGLATGQGLESLHRDMHRAKVPWLEVHAPEGIQVVILLISLCE